MKKIKFTFESKNLVFDWIGFNIQGFGDVKPIAKYLFQNFRFNSTIAKIINGKWKSEALNYASKDSETAKFI